MRSGCRLIEWGNTSRTQVNNKSATANLLNAMTPAEHRQMRAAYEVWRWLRETERLPIVHKMFRDLQERCDAK